MYLHIEKFSLDQQINSGMPFIITSIAIELYNLILALLRICQMTKLRLRDFDFSKILFQ